MKAEQNLLAKRLKQYMLSTTPQTTMKDLERQWGIPYSTVRRVCVGEANPTLDVLVSIAEKLGMKAHELLNPKAEPAFAKRFKQRYFDEFDFVDYEVENANQTYHFEVKPNGQLLSDEDQLLKAYQDLQQKFISLEKQLKYKHTAS